MTEKKEGLAAPTAPKGPMSALNSAHEVRAKELLNADEYIRTLVHRLDSAEAEIARLESTLRGGPAIDNIKKHSDTPAPCRHGGG